ncbi:MAG TPA: endonuclease III [Candidatus Kapabacteria bacterium]|nr:endonuclease III [Candidatus Kapabacteria bacterium]
MKKYNYNNETLENKRKRMANIIAILEKEYPNAHTVLKYNTPFELLVATVLSAQCTDDRVNKVTDKLFKKYITIDDYLKVPQEELEQDIYSTGFYKSKASKIRESARILLEQYNGEMPNTMEELTKLPGVGRKTANVLLANLFNTPGIVVDTHVIRLSNRLGFVDTDNPEKIEYELNEIVPKDQWINFTYIIIEHGRKICTARSPKCNVCSISQYCKYYAELEGEK